MKRFLILGALALSTTLIGPCSASQSPQENVTTIRAARTIIRGTTTKIVLTAAISRSSTSNIVISTERTGASNSSIRVGHQHSDDSLFKRIK